MQLGQTVKGAVGHNEYWPLGQGPLKRLARQIGIESSLSPATAPGKRVRTGRFRKIEPKRAGGSMGWSPQGLRHSTDFGFGFTVF